MTLARAARALAVAVGASLLAAASASAAKPVATLSVGVSPRHIPTVHGPVGTPIELTVKNAFSTDTPGADLFTIQKAILEFPAGATTNGRLFPSCSAARLNRKHNALSACPKGSKIGSGTAVATAIGLGITTSAKVTLFNGPGGHSFAINIHATFPAEINRSFDVPLTRIHGRYAYKLTLLVPHTLQEVITGVFVGLKRFAVTVGATTTQQRHGRPVKRGYLEAFGCSKREPPVHGDFFFLGGATASAEARIPCC